jgi:glycine reductase complex component B subunit gamma
MSKTIRIAHYLNQFFGGVGGEEKASEGPQVKEGPIGPGRAIEASLNGQGEVVATAFCGDNYFAERTQESLAQIIEMLKPYQPDLLLAGPAFNAGRYGVACGEVCQAVEEALGIPVVTAMYEENPGVDLYAKHVYIVKSSDSVKGMNDAVKQMINLGYKLLQNERIGRPADEGYFPRGFVVDEFSALNASERAINMVLAKINGQPIQPEIQLPKFERIKPAPAIEDLASAEIALVTDGGLVPKGNPSEFEPRGATHVGFYEIAGMSRLSADDFEAHHSGYDTGFVNQDPNRLVPLDVMCDLEIEGVIKKVHPVIYATAGVASSLANAKATGQRITEKLKSAGVDGVILTST